MSKGPQAAFDQRTSRREESRLFPGLDCERRAHMRVRVVGSISPPTTFGRSLHLGRIGVSVYTRLRAFTRYPPANSGHRCEPARSKKLCEEGAVEPHGSVNR